MSASRVLLLAAAAVMFMPVSAAAAQPTPAAGAKAGAGPSAAEQEITARVQELLRRYETNDQTGVIDMLDSRFVMLGTNFNERIETHEQLRSLMSNDFAQWGSARFTDVRDLDIRTAENLATVYFTMTFQADSGPTMPIRMFTTWTKSGGRWKLAQSASALPPQG